MVGRLGRRLGGFGDRGKHLVLHIFEGSVIQFRDLTFKCREPVCNRTSYVDVTEQFIPISSSHKSNLERRLQFLSQFAGITYTSKSFQSHQLERHPVKFLAAFRFKTSRSFRIVKSCSLFTNPLTSCQYAGNHSSLYRQRILYFAIHFITCFPNQHTENFLAVSV